MKLVWIIKNSFKSIENIVLIKRKCYMKLEIIVKLDINWISRFISSFLIRNNASVSFNQSSLLKIQFGRRILYFLLLLKASSDFTSLVPKTGWQVKPDAANPWCFLVCRICTKNRNLFPVNVRKGKQHCNYSNLIFTTAINFDTINIARVVGDVDRIERIRTSFRHINISRK